METPQPLSIILEILAEDEQDPDPTAINEVGRSVVDTLVRDGSTVKPIYTGGRGGLELLFHIFMVAGPAIMAQKDTIDVISGLCTVFTTVSAPVLYLFHAHKKQPTREHAIKVAIKIDGAEIEVTSDDVATDERIVQLAQRFHALHPLIKATPQSTVKVQARIPKGPSRRKR